MPTLDLDLAAKTRASAKTEAMLNFNMKTWTTCGTSGCLAGHAEVVQGKDLKEDFERYNDIGSYALLDLLQVEPKPNETHLDASINLGTGAGIGSDLWRLFRRHTLSNEKAIEKFDEFVQKHTSEEEYQAYLHKSWGYEGYLAKS